MHAGAKRARPSSSPSSTPPCITITSESHPPSASNSSSGETLICKWQNCSKSFPKAAELTAHVVDQHVKLQKDSGRYLSGLNCEWQGCEADKKYRDSCNLLIHLRYKHTGERPYPCAVSGCNKAFVQLHHMKQHSRTSHANTMNPTSQPPTSDGNLSPSSIPHRTCEWKDCGTTVDQMESLGTHLLNNHIKAQKLANKKNKKSGFKCEWKNCSRDKPFRSCYQIEQHLRFKHTGERPFACSETNCTARFAQACDLKYHLKLHGIPTDDTSLLHVSAMGNQNSLSPSNINSSGSISDNDDDDAGDDDDDDEDDAAEADNSSDGGHQHSHRSGDDTHHHHHQNAESSPRAKEPKRENQLRDEPCRLPGLGEVKSVIPSTHILVHDEECCAGSNGAAMGDSEDHDPSTNPQLLSSIYALLDLQKQSSHQQE